MQYIKLTEGTGGFVVAPVVLLSLFVVVVLVVV